MFTYTSVQINARDVYSVRADIRVEGVLQCTTTEAYLVITQRRPTSFEVIVQRVGS